MSTLERIARFFRNLQPTEFKSFEEFAGFLKRFGSESVVAELTAENKGENFRCIIHFSAMMLNKGRAIYREEFLWDPKGIGTEHLEDRETRDALSGRLCLIAQAGLTKVRRELSYIRSAIVDLNGDHWVLVGAHWSKR